MNMTPELKNAGLAARIKLIKGGSLCLFDFNGILLSKHEVDFKNPENGVAVGKVEKSYAIRDGTATYAVLTKPNGEDGYFLSVGTKNAEIVLDTVELQGGGLVEIDEITITTT